MLPAVNQEDVLRVYDARYARSYDGRYLRAPHMRPAALYQALLLKRQLTSVDRWLDVACGTGFYLSLFPGVRRRVGIDLSPDMLNVARERAPGARFVRGTFLARRPSWNDRFQLISCMWWAYCLVRGLHEIETLIENLAAWSTRDGCVFVPLCNPRTFSPKVQYPARDPRMPGARITGILWSWEEPGGKTHPHMIAPLPETMRRLFRRRFAHVSVVSAPDLVPRGYWSTDFLLARKG